MPHIRRAKRDRLLQVRVSEAELDLYTTIASENAMDVSEFVRAALRNHAVRVVRNQLTPSSVATAAVVESVIAESALPTSET